MNWFGRWWKVLLFVSLFGVSLLFHSDEFFDGSGENFSSFSQTEVFIDDVVSHNNKTGYVGAGIISDNYRTLSRRLRGLILKISRHFGSGNGGLKEEALAELEYGSRLFAEFKLNEAVIHLARAFELDPSLIRAGMLKAKALFYLGRENEALEGFQALSARFPEYGEALLWIGKAYYILGRSQEARQYFLKYLEANSSRGDVYYMLGEIDRRSGKYESALNNYSKAELDLDVIAISRLRKAEIYMDLGNYKKANQLIDFVMINKKDISIDVIEEAIKLLYRVNLESKESH